MRAHNRSMKIFTRLLPLLFVTIGFFGPGLRAQEGVEQDAGTIIIPDGVKDEAVQKAIVVSGIGRGWQVRAKEDGKVVLFLEHGGWRSVLTFVYEKRLIAISSNSDKLDRHGNPKKHAVPEGWVKFLKQDISARLSSAAFEK